MLKVTLVCSTYVPTSPCLVFIFLAPVSLFLHGQFHGFPDHYRDHLPHNVRPMPLSLRTHCVVQTQRPQEHVVKVGPAALYDCFTTFCQSGLAARPFNPRQPSAKHGTKMASAGTRILSGATTPLTSTQGSLCWCPNAGSCSSKECVFAPCHTSSSTSCAAAFSSTLRAGSKMPSIPSARMSLIKEVAASYENNGRTRRWKGGISSDLQTRFPVGTQSTGLVGIEGADEGSGAVTDIYNV